MRPPFKTTTKILRLTEAISRLVGTYEGLHAPRPQPKLRRQNRIKTIQGSLAIEGNTLNLEQVTALFDQKRVAGPKKDIMEVQNAIQLYDQLRSFSPTHEKDLLRAHSLLMNNLDASAGRYRTSGVGILKGTRVAHIAPPPKRVPELMSGLFRFLKTDQELPVLIRACVFHYELEFIHPFADGNGRMGRFWQTLILAKDHGVFEFIPFESIIKERQAQYYRALEISDKKGESTEFVEFSLDAILAALKDFLHELKPESSTPGSRLELARQEFKERTFSRNDYLKLLKNISTATASRDLATAVSNGALNKAGNRALTRYRFT